MVTKITVGQSTASNSINSPEVHRVLLLLRFFYVHVFFEPRVFREWLLSTHRLSELVSICYEGEVIYS